MQLRAKLRFDGAERVRGASVRSGHQARLSDHRVLGPQGAQADARALHSTFSLTQVYHTEKIYEQCEGGFQQLNAERRKFEEWLVGALQDGYKILGMNCGEGVFTPHQKYMDVSQHFKATL